MKHSQELYTELETLLERVYQIGTELDYSNILYNEQFSEILIANKLGHIANPGQGPDAFSVDGEKGYEYKTINNPDAKGSFQFHWISKEKLEEYESIENCYFAVRDDAIILEIYELPMSSIIGDLREKYNQGEEKRQIMEASGIKKKKNIDAHKSYSLKQVKERKAKLVYEHGTKWFDNSITQ